MTAQPSDTATERPSIPRDAFSALLGAGECLAAYRLLVDAAVDPALAPDLWERLAVGARHAGLDALASLARAELIDGEVASAATIVAEAEALLAAGDIASAERLLVDRFGAHPRDPAARFALASAIADAAPQHALDLLNADDPGSMDAAILAVDLLRRMDRLRQALDLVRHARDRFARDGRCDLREARILEAMGDWDAAIDMWQRVRAENPPEAGVAVFQLARIHARMEDGLAANALFADLYRTDLTTLARLQLAVESGLPQLAPAILTHAVHRPTSKSQWYAISLFLRDHGRLGAIAWLAERVEGIAPHLSAAIEAAVQPKVLQRLRNGTSEQAWAARTTDLIFPVSPDLSAQFRRRIEDVPAEDGPPCEVLLVNATLAGGGAERQFLALARALILAGRAPASIHLAFLTLAPDRQHDHFLGDARALGVTIHDLGSQGQTVAEGDNRLGPLGGVLPEPLRRDVLRLAPLARRLRPSILHGWQDRASLAAGVVGTLLGDCKVVMSARNMRPQERGQTVDYAFPLYRFLTATAGFRLTANARAAARDYEEWLGLATGEVMYLPNGVDTEALGPRKARRRRATITIGGVFRLAANKRPELWVETAAQLAELHPGPLRFKVIGRGPFEAAMMRRAQELDLSAIEFTDHSGDIDDLYKGIDALLLMSRVEGTPNVLLEAQALGVPVAACDVGGVAEAMLTEGPGAGLLLPRDIRPDDAARQISDWLASGVLAHPGPRRDFISRNFGLPHVGRVASDLYSRDRVRALS